MKTAKALIATELGLTLLSGAFAALNHSLRGPADVTIIFTVLAAVAAVFAAAMAAVLWLFTLPAGETQ